MKVSTRLTSLLGIEVPIIQAPIGSATTPELVAAVSNAGAMGMLALSWCGLSETRQRIRKTKELTQSPFGINLVLAWPQRERLETALEEGVSFISTFWGDPGPYVGQVHSAEATHIHTVGTWQEARRAADVGVDVIIAQGIEAGGHVWGRVSTLELVQSVSEHLDNLPVVAAGGIADAEGMAAALRTGADGVWMGTRFLCSAEANVARVYQEKIVEATRKDTVLTKLFDKGWPDASHRVIRNSSFQMWEAAGGPNSGQRPGERDVVARFPNGDPVERYSDVIPTREMKGHLEALALYAGHSVEFIHDVRPAGQIVRTLHEQTIKLLDA